jgi:hypothetical protein
MSAASLALTGTPIPRPRPTEEGIIRSMPQVHLIAGLPAILVIARFKRDGQVLVLVDADQPWRLILNLSRPLLPHDERRELARVLLSH